MNIQEEIKSLRRLWGSYWQARVLLTANNLRVFDHLKTAKSASQIAGLISADPRATEILLDAVAGLGLLKKKSGLYRNSAVADQLLVNGMPYYQGDILRHADNLWINWSNLDEVVKTGLPTRKAFGTDAFIRGMHNIAISRAKETIRAINLKGVRKALDLGGGPGTYSIEMARRVDSVTLFDLPATIAIATDIIDKSGLRNISFMEGDFLIDDIGNGYDLVLISQVLHSFSADNSRKVLQKAHKALNTNGRVVIQEHYLAADRTKPVHGSLFSVNMLVNTHGGRSYSVPEIKEWLTSAGFNKTGHKLMGDNVLVTGRKISER
ncbi:MAG TPA: methyltransferase [Dissulfurispiraceae bacterium]|nr:methyltransferase [Dissulfurispiraceae bacterium]